MPEPKAAPPDTPAGPALRPDPVLAVGFAADAASRDDGHAASVATEVLAVLLAECGRIAAREPDFFSGRAPRLRLLTRPPRSAVEQAVVAAAGEIGAEVAIIPGRSDIAGEGDDGGQAGDLLLDGSDLLLALWDGRPGERGSTAALVQAAVARGLPVLLRPDGPGGEVGIVADPEELLLPADAASLPRVALSQNLDRVLARAFAPPTEAAEREAWRGFLREPARPRSRRPEYAALLLLASGPPPTGTGMTSREEWARAEALAALVSPEAVAAVSRIRSVQARMEDLAAFYGRRVRSGIVLRYGMPALGGLAVALLAIVAPQIGLAWLGVQAVVMTLTIGEATWAVRRRWNERWLDYRSLAERLRCDRFLVPFGLAIAGRGAEAGPEEPAWTLWLRRRLVRERWAGGTLGADIVGRALDHLVAVELAGQIRYHEAADRRFRNLSRRLRMAGIGSIVCVVAASAVLFALSLADSAFPLIQALIMAALITLPSAYLATRGIRLEGSFDLAAARSRQASTTLRRLRDRIGAATPSLVRLAEASRAAAAAMILDTADWRIGLQHSRNLYRAEPDDSATPPARPVDRPP